LLVSLLAFALFDFLAADTLLLSLDLYFEPFPR
jgi:hypothetical protein